MGGMTSSSSTTQQQYPKFVEGFGKDYFKDASRAFNQGPRYFKGDTTTPMSLQTMSGLGYEIGPDGKMRPTGGGMSGLASANSNGQGMSDNLQQIMSNGGFSNGQLDTFDSMKALRDNPAMNALIGSQDGLSADQRLVQDRNRGIMNSPFDLNSNPAYASVRQNALDTQADALSARAAAAGRYGGGMDQAILAREQGKLGGQMDYNQYLNWQDQGNRAADSLFSGAQTGFGNQSSAIGQKAGIQNNMFNAQQAGLSNMGQAYETAMQPYQTQRAIGQQFEDLYTRQMQDRLRRFDAKNPFNHLQQYGSLLSGAPTNTVQTQNPSMLNTVLGGLLAGSAFI